MRGEGAGVHCGVLLALAPTTVPLARGTRTDTAFPSGVFDGKHLSRAFVGVDTRLSARARGPGSERAAGAPVALGPAATVTAVRNANMDAHLRSRPAAAALRHPRDLLKEGDSCNS